jgi:hypothetical protein
MFSEGYFLRDVFGRGVFWGMFSRTFSFSRAFSEGCFLRDVLRGVFWGKG